MVYQTHVLARIMHHAAHFCSTAAETRAIALTG